MPKPIVTIGGVVPYLRRSFFYVPASNPRFLEKALSRGADTVVFDLEDGVAVNKKDEARDNLLNFFKELQSKKDVESSESEGLNSNISSKTQRQRKPELCLRVNPIEANDRSSALAFRDDLKLLNEFETLPFTSIAIPKVLGAETIKDVGNVFRDIVKRHDAKNLSFIAILESAQGVLNAHQVLKAGLRVNGIVFGAEDYAADLGIQRTKSMENMLFARSTIIHAARTINEKVHVIDAVCQDYKDGDILTAECENGKSLGFDGKQCVHPNQVDTINAVFRPSEDEVEHALRLLEAQHQNAEKGIGAFEIDGKMVDRPVFELAKHTLRKAKAADMTLPDWVAFGELSEADDEKAAKT